MEPMLLKPSGKNYLWGGSRLKSEYNKEIEMNPLAETWECSAHPDGPSIIDSGIFKGKTLKEVLEEYPDFLGTKVNGELPILVKFIDAEKDLSVQVHPNDEYAKKHEYQNGKTEMWYVLDAKPETNLICGFSHDVTEAQLREGIKTGELKKHLQIVKVNKGDKFFIPAGMIHAIGAGALIAEIQESSNVTYRIYDYNRIDNNGKRRKLQFDKAIKVLNMKAENDVRQGPRIVNYYPGCSREMLCRCKYFETERIIVNINFKFLVMDFSFQVILCLDGKGDIKTEAMNCPLFFKKGDCIFIPAGLGKCYVSGNTELLKIRC